MPDDWATVGEVHRWGQWITSNTLTYGRTADSDFQIAFKAGTGGWGVNGSAHVGNSGSQTGSTNVTASRSATGYQVEAKFHNGEYAQVCTTNLKRQAESWDGLNVRRATAISGLDGHCGDTYAQFANTFAPSQTAWSRSSSQAFTWSNTLDLVVLSVGGHSGYSSSVTTSWVFKSGQQKKLCGNDALPPTAHRVFAGN